MGLKRLKKLRRLQRVLFGITVCLSLTMNILYLSKAVFEDPMSWWVAVISTYVDLLMMTAGCLCYGLYGWARKTPGKNEAWKPYSAQWQGIDPYGKNTLELLPSDFRTETHPRGPLIFPGDLTATKRAKKEDQETPAKKEEQEK